MAVNYGSSGRSLMNSTAGIVDTGSTLVLLPSDAFDIYTNTTGAASDYKTGLLKISEENYNKLESMYFEIDECKLIHTSISRNIVNII